MIEGYRLSPHQLHLWGLQAERVYRSQIVLQIENTLNMEMLNQALQVLIDRHEILRTTFHRQAGVKAPVQVVNPQSCFDFRILDWSDSEGDKIEDSIRLFLEEERQIPIQLDQLPLLRVRVLDCPEGRMIIVLTLPALCADGWTMQLFRQDLVMAYLKGSSAFSVEVQGQYLQFSEWQNQLLEDPDDSQQGIEFWQNQDLVSLADPILPLERESEGLFDPKIHSFLISVNQAQEIRALVKSLGKSIEQVFFTVWLILIGKLTQQQRIKVYITCQGRPFDELQRIMGIMAKSLPIQCVLQENYTFREALDRIAAAHHEAETWQDFYLWQDQSAPIGFEMDQEIETSGSTGLKITQIQGSSDWDVYKLKLICRSTREGIKVDLRYNSRVFSPGDVQRIGDRFRLLVKQILDEPQIKLKDLSLLGPTEKQKVLIEFNDTETVDPDFPCLHRWFEAQVRQTPDQIALVCEDQQLTYRELNARANQLAHHLNRRGVRLESPVALYLGRSPLVIIAILAVLKAGGAYLALDQDLPTEGITIRLHQACCSLVVTQQIFKDKLPDSVSSSHIISLDTEWEQISQESSDDLILPTYSRSLSYVLFTSGSTGQPKGVAVEHRQIVNYVYTILTRLDLPVGTQFATVSSFAADLGNTMIFPALCSGGTLHVLTQERVANPNALTDYIQTHPIDCLKIVPSHLAVLLASPQANSLLPHRYLILGGETTRWDLINQLRSLSPQCQILNHYGPTETTVGVVMQEIPAQKDTPAKTAPLGQPLPNARIYILDDDLNPLPIGLAGELYIAGAGLSRGYLRHPDLSAERFIPDPYSLTPGGRLYRTGDRARYLPNGSIEFLGRVDHQVKIRGFRVELGEIETVLNTHPGIRQAVITLWGEQSSDPRLVAYVVQDPSHPPNTSDLRGFLKQKLPAALCPSLYIPLRIFPLTPNGKVDRKALPSPDLSRPDLEARYEPPRTDLERTLAKIWQEVLQVKQVGIHDTFFDLGGHSLLLIQLHTRLQTVLTQPIQITDLFRYPTIHGLAQFLSQSIEPDTGGLEQSQQRASARLASRGQRSQSRQQARTQS